MCSQAALSYAHGKTLLESILPGDYCNSIDLKDAYFHVPIANRSWCSSAGLQGIAYDYTRVPFGALAPTFPIVETALSRDDEESGVLAYLDDLVNSGIVSRDGNESHESIGGVIHTVGTRCELEEELRWWPSQKATYLGLFLDTAEYDSGHGHLSDGRTESILSALRLCRLLAGGGSGNHVPVSSCRRSRSRNVGVAACAPCNVGLLDRE
ncbi:hypothetical protein DPEC_G00108750 [Dallia pectoralis]|uniref:Uncharacterized protein n=1 Tax=Dallia pectoralis TaxID=75939 RepID=A0ACC2GSM7_DALPE|nr:hypothetical protein DPEC_G00108750 [Dallia pectoralis]